MRRDSSGKQSFDAGTAARAGMHRQAGRLVQHDEALVPEQDGDHRAATYPPVPRHGTLRRMRIHIQNPADDPLFEFSRAMWDAAVARAPDIGRGHSVTIGDTDADFAAAMLDAEALVCDVSVVRALFPCAAPHLKLLFVTNAGSRRLAPFDWLPPGVALLNNRGTHAVKSGEFAIMAVLMLANRVPEMVTHQRAGRWQKLWGTVLGGKRLTVVGLGTLGGATAAHAAALRHARDRRAGASRATSGLRRR